MDPVLADESGDRRDVDDGASAGLAHGGNRVLHTEKDALGVHVHEGVPGRRALRVGIERAADARVVDEDMELAEAHHGGGDGVPPVRLASNVELHETRLRARLGDVRGHLGPLGFEKVADDDLRALPGEDCHLAPAHTAGAAGDERDLPREPHEGGGSTSRAPEVRSRYLAGISRPASR